MPRWSTCKMAADGDDGRLCVYTCMPCLQKTILSEKKQKTIKLKQQYGVKVPICILNICISDVHLHYFC